MAGYLFTLQPTKTGIMKKLTIILLLTIFAGLANAQKFAFVDTDYILDNIPEYKAAQKQLDDLSVQWQKQIEAKYAEIDKLYKAFQQEQILLTEDMKRKRENEIIQKEKEAKDFQKSKFGVDGELFKKRQELVKPLQDKVFAAIKDISTSGNFSIVFDKAGQSNILFADSKYDKSDEVLKKLGFTPSEKTEGKPEEKPNQTPGGK